MMMIRHAEAKDLKDIFCLAEKSGVGFTSLPVNMDILSNRVKRTRKTLTNEVPESDKGYLFVLEDLQTKRVVGLSAIEVAVGLTSPFYSYHVGTQVHASDELDVYKTLDTLFLSNDLTGTSELCSLILDPDYRVNYNGRFLSKVRFLFISAFQQHFKQKIIAEMRGRVDVQGQSPFWNALGQHFFKMDFATADYLSGIGKKAFIAELMPRFPVYVDLLPAEARQVIGRVHEQTVPAYQMLLAEGLQCRGYIDIFDGGPTVEAEIKDLTAVKSCRVVQVKIVDRVDVTDVSYMVANDSYKNYRVILVCNRIEQDINILEITQEQADLLNVKDDDYVRILALQPKEISSCS